MSHDGAGEIRTSRAAKVIEVSISSADAGRDLPMVALTACLPEVGGLVHEHVVIGLSVAVLDAIQQARAELPDLVIT